MRSNRRSRFRLALFLGTGLGAAAIALTAYLTGVLRTQELASVDARFSIRGTLPQPKDVVVVQINDDTFSDFADANLPNHWPFSRYYHAKVINTLRKDGAKVIAYDIQFTEPTSDGPDNALINAVRNARNVVLATVEVNSKGQSNVFGGADAQRYARAQVGDASYGVDPGATIRRMYYAPQGLTSFPILAAEKFLDTKITRADMGGNSAWIDYVGPPGSIRGAGDHFHPANRISFSQVYFGKVPASVFRNKLVVVGPASATLLGDVHATSTTGSGVMSGVEVEASAMENAIQGFPLRSYSRGADILLIILLALIPSFTSLKLPPLRALFLTVLLAAGFAAAVQFAFNHGRIVAFVYPLLALTISAIGSLAVNYLLTAFDRERTRNAFARFVPEGVVTQVLAQAGDGLRLGGRSVLCTVLFSDIRGFTTLSETRSAEEVIDFLNHYLTEMTDAVLNNGGTLVSYSGDGILACFGAPIEQEDHADRAVASAREMIERRLPAVNEWLRGQGQDFEVKIGVGINSGETMVGNVGSERRLEYTTIGDTVNTASRLEGMTKGTPYSIFVADSTVELMSQQPEDMVFVDELSVRGRTGTVKVWAVPDPVPAEEPVEAGPELATT